MTVIYYTNNGTEVKFERNTLDECIEEYYRRRQWLYNGPNWGHAFINGERVWL